MSDQASSKIKFTVDRIESHIQTLEVEVDANLSEADQIKQAQQLANDDNGEYVGSLEFRETDDSPENWSVFNHNKKQVS